MTKQKENESHVVFLLDQTGSMESCKKDTIGGFNTFIKEQKAKKGRLKFTMTLFNSLKVEKRYTSTEIKDVIRLSEKSYVPAGLTPLWDAIGNTIQEFSKDKNVFFIILTDGFENYSKEFKPDVVKRLIQEKQDKSKWTFLYLGADITNFDDAMNVGINLNFTVDKSNMQQAYSSLSSSVSCYRDSGNVTYDDKYQSRK